MSNDIAHFEEYESSAASRLAAALSCIRRGWPVVPLHDVAMGYCSCGDTSAKHMEKSAGKHPLAKSWGPGALRDETLVASVFSGRPDVNFGIKTGLEAGIWALDVDPKNGGDIALAELVKAHGALPDTYTQRTGSGGLHHLFSLPHDFTPTNSPGSLPAGLDVRGEGGFVVAAPCRSGVGQYEVLLNLPTVGAPDWLLEMIRPRVPADREHREAMAHWDSPAVAGQSDRLVRYAYAAAMAELNSMAQAPAGRRNTTTYNTACSLIELVNSPWSGITEETAKAWFAQAAAMLSDGDFDQTEAWGAWGSAARKIGARGRAAPDGPPGGVLIPWRELGGVPPFSPSSPSGQSVNGSLGQSPNSGPIDWTQSPTLSIGPAGAPNDLVQSIGPGETGVPAYQDPVDAMISTFLDSEALSKLPPPDWLIKEWLPLGGLIQTVGQPSHGKSFVALDQAMHVALGRAWHGQAVRKAQVGYMVAEGAPGMGQRVKAWEQRFHAGERVEGIIFVPYPIQASDNERWETFIMACVRLGLGYIVVDTQARATVGMDENSAKEMGQFIHQVERLRAATGAAVNLVHHQNKAGSSARGSNAMFGALHTEITVSKNRDRVTAAVTKQKDAQEAEPLTLQLVGEWVDLPSKAVQGGPEGWTIGSVDDGRVSVGVLIGVDKVDAREWDQTDAKGRMMMLLRDIFPLRGATKAEAVAEARKRGMEKSTSYWAWDQILGTGLIARAVVDDRPTDRYVVTPHEDRIPAQEA